MVEIDAKEIIEAGKENDFVILGEIHGSKQNAVIIQDLIRGYISEEIFPVLALEWGVTAEEYELLNQFIKGSKDTLPFIKFFLDSDGRFTYEHLDLLRFIRAHNLTAEPPGQVELCFFENEDNASSEKNLADALADCKKKYPEKLILVEVGNFHAKKYDSVESMASLLPSHFKVLSILLKYHAGKVLVEEQELNVNEAFSQQESESKYFDAILGVPLSEPAEKISLLKLEESLV